MSYDWYLAGLGVLVVERLVELFLSKRNRAWALGAGGLEVGETHYRLMVLLHSSFLVATALEPWLFGRPFVPSVGWSCFGLALVAQALRYWAIFTLGRRWNTRVIVLPDLEPVTAGPYRWLKHPNYVAVIVELAVVPLIHGAFLTACCFSLLNGALLAVRIHVEEEALGARWREAFEGRARFIPGARW